MNFNATPERHIMKRVGTRRSIATVALFALVGLTAACGGDDDAGDGAAVPGSKAAEKCENVNLKYAAYSPATSPTVKAFEWYAGELEKRTDGCVKIDITHTGALLAGDKMLNGIATRQADLGQLQPLYYPAELPLSQVVGIPFTNKGNPTAVSSAFASLYEKNEAFRSEYEKQNVVVLTWDQLGTHVMGTKKPLDLSSLDSLKGLKIRSAGTVTQLFEAVDASPIAMPAGDQYEALQRGTINAYASQVFEYGPSLKLYEVAPHTYDTGTGIFATVSTAMNKEVYESLPENVKDVMNELKGEYDEQLAKIVAETSKEACDLLIEGGGTLEIFPDNLVSEWESRVGDSIKDSWAKTAGDAGGDFLNEYTSAVESAQTDGYVPATQECAERAKG